MNCIVFECNSKKDVNKGGGIMDNRKGVVLGILFGVITLAFPIIFYYAIEPYLVETIQRFPEDYETTWEAFKGLQKYLISRDIDEKIPAYSILPYAAYCFLLAIIAPFIFPDEDDMRAYARIFLVFSIIMNIVFVVFAVQMGEGNMLIPIANFVFTGVALAVTVGIQEYRETGSVSANRVIVIIFTND